MGLKRNINMDFMKNAFNSAAEGANKAADAIKTKAFEKELEAQIWNNKRKVTSLQGEWGVAAFDAFINNDATLGSITDGFKHQIDELRALIEVDTKKLQDEFGHAPTQTEE